jgi:GNAT superfamily N-acetyltransferase
MMVETKYKINKITNQIELDTVLAFTRSVFSEDTIRNCPAEYSRDTWLARMPNSSELMLFAVQDGIIIGTTLGIVENNNSVTVGAVATDENHRHCGVASALLRELEKRAAAADHHFIVLGALESAEGFYLKCGYLPHLFVQAKLPLQLDQLRSLNQQYEEAWTYDDGRDIRLCLKTPQIDRELQRRYENTFPSCSTQTLFTKYV